ncbi:MAG: VPLPA-CTERM sorting domain-containing protein [Desulfobacterium sp.]|nr:VPLPA-CTERM sorting domain-containing protein [Desulfobacterium sp.]
MNKIYTKAIFSLFIVITFCSNAFASFSIDISTNYAAGGNTAIFDVSFNSDATHELGGMYGFEFIFDQTELEFASYTNDLLPGSFEMLPTTADQANGTLNGFNATNFGSSQVSSGTTKLGSFVFNVKNPSAIKDDDTISDFNFDLKDEMFAFEVDGITYDLNTNSDSLKAVVSANYTDIGTSSSVPVPAAFWLLGSGLAGLVGIRRKMT